MPERRRYNQPPSLHRIEFDMKKVKIIISACLAFLTAIPCFGMLPQDSLWIHVASLTDKREGNWVVLDLGWEAYIKEYDEETDSYGEWRGADELDSINIEYIAQCSRDSMFQNISAAGTTNAQSYTFGGIEMSDAFYVRAFPLESINPYRCDFAMGFGYGKSDDEISELAAKHKRGRNIVMAVSVLAIALGVGIEIGILIGKKKIPETLTKGGEDA